MKKFRKTKVNLIVCVCLALFAISFLATNVGIATAAEKWPRKTITMVVPWSTGGRTDLLTRIVAPVMSDYLGVSVVVINKPGATGTVGTHYVATQKPDGYTVAMTSNSTILSQYTVLSPINMLNYEWFGMIKYDPATLTINASLPFKTIQDLIAHAKGRPGELKNAVSGVGSSDRMFSEAFAKAAGIEFTQVPFKGDGPAVTSVAGGHSDTNFSTIISVKALVDAGKLRILGLASEKRSELYPNVPTWKEQGIDMTIGSWEGMAVPRGTPKEVIEKLSAALEHTLTDKETVARLEKAGINIHYMPYKEFTRFVLNQDRYIEDFVDKLGLRVSKK